MKAFIILSLLCFVTVISCDWMDSGVVFWPTDLNCKSVSDLYMCNSTIDCIDMMCKVLQLKNAYRIVLYPIDEPVCN